VPPRFDRIRLFPQSAEPTLLNKQLEKPGMPTEEPDVPENGSRDGPTGGTESNRSMTGRRGFFARIVELIAAGVAVLFAIPIVRYLLYPISVTGDSSGWSNLGPSSQFESISEPVSHMLTVRQNDGWLESDAKRPVYITKGSRDGALNGVEVLTAVCPHLGCTVQWSEKTRQFLCPCHGSVFSPDGARIAGPTPRGMDTLPIEIRHGDLMARYEDFQQLLPTKQVLG
jgi:menaquinol-cytochrome c reductase iron-sulfur subunit